MKHEGTAEEIERWFERSQWAIVIGALIGALAAVAIIILVFILFA